MRFLLLLRVIFLREVFALTSIDLIPSPLDQSWWWWWWLYPNECVNFTFMKNFVVHATAKVSFFHSLVNVDQIKSRKFPSTFQWKKMLKYFRKLWLEGFWWWIELCRPAETRSQASQVDKKNGPHIIIIMSQKRQQEQGCCPALDVGRLHQDLQHLRPLQVPPHKTFVRYSLVHLV